MILPLTAKTTYSVTSMTKYDLTDTYDLRLIKKQTI